MKTFGIFTNEGLPVTFYNEDVHGYKMLSVYGPVPEPTEEEPNPIAPVIGEKPNPDCLIPDNAIEIAQDQWLEFINNGGRRKLLDSHVVVYDPPPPAPIIPDRVSRRQFRSKLFDDGLLASVEAWIAKQDAETQMAYADAATFVRTDEMLQQGFTALGLTTAQVDQFFTTAAAL